MYRITLWNRNSTDFGKNSFVRLNGTDSFTIKVEANALACMMSAVRNPAIQRATMNGPQGTLSWTKSNIEDFRHFPRPTTSHSDPADECDYCEEYTNTCPKCGNENCVCGDYGYGDCRGSF